MRRANEPFYLSEWDIPVVYSLLSYSVLHDKNSFSCNILDYFFDSFVSAIAESIALDPEDWLVFP